MGQLAQRVGEVRAILDVELEDDGLNRFLRVTHGATVVSQLGDQEGGGG
jgi:hypothetical protein